MSSSESDISNDSDRSSYDSEEHYSAVEVEEESETLGACAAPGLPNVDDVDDDDFDDDEGPHQFDPVADEAYTAAYRREVAEAREEDHRLMRRFEGVEPLESWYVLLVLSYYDRFD